MKNENYCFLELMYTINDTDFYMKALTIGGNIIKIKLSKEEYEKLKSV